MIPVDPAKPWLRTVLGSKPDTSVEMMAHIALTYRASSDLGSGEPRKAAVSCGRV
jgi:hypothetical protein